METEYISDDLYARRWEKKEYKGPGFDNTSPESITDKEKKSGLKVKSSLRICSIDIITGNNLILTFETEELPLNLKTIDLIIKKNLLDH